LQGAAVDHRGGTIRRRLARAGNERGAPAILVEGFTGLWNGDDRTVS
jgi:hypothetical protein